MPYVPRQHWNTYAVGHHRTNDSLRDLCYYVPTRSSFLPIYEEVVVGMRYPCWGFTSPAAWTNTAQGIMASTDSPSRFLVDIRKAAVHAQHIAWHGVHHRATNTPWDIHRPWYIPAPGSDMPTIKNDGHYLPYNAFALDLYQDPNGAIAYGPASCRRDRYPPHGSLIDPNIAPALRRGDTIWISAPAQVNTMLIGTPVYVVENLHDVNIAGYGIVDHGWLCSLSPTPVLDRITTHEELVVVGRQRSATPPTTKPTASQTTRKLSTRTSLTG